MVEIVNRNIIYSAFILLFICGCNENVVPSESRQQFFYVSSSTDCSDCGLDTVVVQSGKLMLHDSNDTLLYKHRFLFNDKMHEIRKYTNVNTNHMTPQVLYEMDSVGVILKSQLSVRAYTYMISSNDSLNGILDFARSRITYYSELERMLYFERNPDSNLKESAGLKNIKKVMNVVW